MNFLEADGLTPSQVTDLVAVVPFLSFETGTSVIRFLKEIYKMHNLHFKLCELVEKYKSSVSDEYATEVFQKDLELKTTYEKATKVFRDAYLNLTEFNEDENSPFKINSDNVPNFFFLRKFSEDTGYVEPATLSLLATKCFGSEFVSQLDFSSGADNTIMSLAKALGIPEAKSIALKNLLLTVIGD